MKLFTLDSPKINEILYSMENQRKRAYIDITTGTIEEENSSFSSNSKIYPLPKWNSIDGFRVMNNFVFQIKNPIVKGELMAVLNSGYGVFRKFKNILKSHLEIEKNWFLFKKGEMKAHILNWYNEVREYTGLESLPQGQIEEELDCVDFDFYIEKGKREIFNIIKDWDKKAFFEFYAIYQSDIINDMYNSKRTQILKESMFVDDEIFIAKTPSNELVGFIWGTGYILGKLFLSMELIQLYVTPEYRGLGIGKSLLIKLIDQYRKGDYKELIVNSKEENSWIAKYLEQEKFSITSQELCFKS